MERTLRARDVPRSISIFDVDRDGREDLLISEENYGVQLFRNAPGAPFDTRESYHLRGTLRSIIAGDFGGDDSIDLGGIERGQGFLTILTGR